MEDGTQKKVSELYVVDAVSFGDAEKSIASEMSAYVSGELEIKNINPAAYGEIFLVESLAQGFLREGITRRKGETEMEFLYYVVAEICCGEYCLSSMDTL